MISYATSLIQGLDQVLAFEQFHQPGRAFAAAGNLGLLDGRKHLEAPFHGLAAFGEDLTHTVR
jgi:hypothetical protein